MDQFEVADRLAMMSDEGVLKVAEYRGNRSDRRFDAAMAKQELRKRIRDGRVDNLDAERCEALGLTR